MNVGCIYYLIPNLSPPPLNIRKNLLNNPKELIRRIQKRVKLKRMPIIGGIKVHYQHCEILNKLGYRAYPVLMGKRELYAFGYAGKVLTQNELGSQLNDNDIVVGAEFCPYEALQFQGGKRAVFVQNWVNLTPNRRFRPEDDSRDYLDMGYDYVLACSSYIQRYIQEKMGISSHLLRNGIDLSRFTPQHTSRIEHRVLYLPRKNHADVQEIMNQLSGEGFEFVAADGLSESDLIVEFQKSDIFLASGYPEGFGLPPLEAMACGCAVVGYTGRGADEFMINEKTALVSEDGDCASVAENLRRLKNDPDLKESLRRSGLEMAKNYSLERMSEGIHQFYQYLDRELEKDREACL